MAAEEFRVEIPFDTGSFSSGSTKKDKTTEELNKNIINLDKTVYGTMDILEMLSSLLGDVYKLLSPLFKLLSIILLIIFMPLMPIIKLIAQGLAWLAKTLSGSGDNIWDSIASWLWIALVAVGAIILVVVAGWAVWLVGLLAVIVLAAWKYIRDALVWVWDNLLKPAFTAIGEGLKTAWELIKKGFQLVVDGIKWVWTGLMKPAWDWLAGCFKWIWEGIIYPAFNFLKDVGLWIWDRILKPAWEWFKDIGTKIWDILKKPFDWLASKIKSINIFKKDKETSINDAIIKPDGSIIRTHPKDYIFATKTPEKLTGQNTITLNINNPIVREDKDIKRIAEEVSKVIERRLWRSY